MKAFLIYEPLFAEILFALLLLLISVFFIYASIYANKLSRESKERRANYMKNKLIDRDFLISIGFERCAETWIKDVGHDIYFYDHCDVYIHFNNVEQEDIPPDEFRLTNMISKTDLIQHLVNHKVEASLDVSQNFYED